MYEAHIFFDNAYNEHGQYNEYVRRLLDLIPFFVPDVNEYVYSRELTGLFLFLYEAGTFFNYIELKIRFKKLI